MIVVVIFMIVKKLIIITKSSNNENRNIMFEKNKTNSKGLRKVINKTNNGKKNKYKK